MDNVKIHILVICHSRRSEMKISMYPFWHRVLSHFFRSQPLVSNSVYWLEKHKQLYSTRAILYGERLVVHGSINYYYYALETFWWSTWYFIFQQIHWTFDTIFYECGKCKIYFRQHDSATNLNTMILISVPREMFFSA